MDSFGMAELLDSGILVCGDDIRHQMTYPTYAQMRDDIARHIQAVRTPGLFPAENRYTGDGVRL
jgi:hypothetical protein